MLKKRIDAMYASEPTKISAVVARGRFRQKLNRLYFMRVFPLPNSQHEEYTIAILVVPDQATAIYATAAYFIFIL